jgi:hypothetical protein
MVRLGNIRGWLFQEPIGLDSRESKPADSAKRLLSTGAGPFHVRFPRFWLISLRLGALESGLPWTGAF